MADDFYLDEDGVVSFADGLAGTGKSVTSSYTRLTDTLTAYQGCWGSDDIGKGFEDNYYGNAEKFVDGMKGGGEDIVTGADDTKKAAHMFADLDLDTAKWLDSQKPDDSGS